jgi:hypothetical protein
MDKSFQTFTQNIIGFSFVDISRKELYSHLITYLYDFFPSFDAMNPFEDPEAYKFPYNNIGFAHLNFVYQLKNRMELLDIAEKEKMGISKFYNYIINYVKSYNEDIGNENYYQINHNFSGSPYIKRLTYRPDGIDKKERRCLFCDNLLVHTQKKFCSVNCQHNYNFKSKRKKK